MRRGGFLIAVMLLATAWAGCVTLPGSSGTNVDTASAAEVAGFTGTSVYPGTYEDGDPFSRVLEDGAFDILAPEVVALESPLDGEKIEMAVVRPDVPEGTLVPVIVQASPYFAPMHVNDPLDFEPRLVENFVPHGYAVAFLAVRGTSDSGGCMDLMGPAERADLDAAVTWLGTQDWSNGNVGMIGVSYDGSTPWEVAATGNPHLKTIVPISGLSDIYDLAYRNGSAELRMAGLVSGVYYTYGFLLNNPMWGRDAGRTVTGAVCPESWEGFGAAFESTATGERDAFGFWAERNSRPGVEENYEGSILLVHGLQDWNVDPHHAYPWVNTLEDRGIVVKHLLGQWGHAWPDGDYLDKEERRLDFAEILLHWFDRWLKEDASVDLGPRAQVQDSAGGWRDEAAWPPADRAPDTWYLSQDLKLTRETPGGASDHVLAPVPAGLFTGDALWAGDCASCVTFTTDAFEEDYRFAGLPRVHVTVTPSGPGGNLAGFLYTVGPGDEWETIGWGQMDLRFADGGYEARTVMPGEKLVARMELEPLDAVVPAGSKLGLIVYAGNYADRLPSPVQAPVTLHAGEESVLVVDAFARGEDAFFEPPR